MRLLALLCLTAAWAVAAPAPTKTEPTNAQEAAAKKAAQDKVVDERYAAWVAKLSPAEQEWERILHQRDKLAGKSNAWDFVKDDP